MPPSVKARHLITVCSDLERGLEMFSRVSEHLSCLSIVGTK